MLDPMLGRHDWYATRIRLNSLALFTTGFVPLVLIDPLSNLAIAYLIFIVLQSTAFVVQLLSEIAG